MRALLRRAYQLAGRPAWVRLAFDRIARPRTPDEYLPREWSDMVCAWCGGMRGKRLLDVGCDVHGSLVRQFSKLYQTSEAVGLNPSFPGRELAPGVSIVQGDIRRAPFPDRHFDVIVSSSCFEHIHDLDLALLEMHRVLKPGGYLFSHFGPIWSTSYGHHLWLVHDGTLYNYHNLILPPYAHLLMTPQQLADHVAGSHGPHLGRLVSNYVFTSPEQNRLFYEDYQSIFARSPFRVLLFKGYDTEIRHAYDGLITPETLRSLRERYPDHHQFGYCGITALMDKPP